MDYQLNVVDVDNGKIIACFSGDDPLQAFILGDKYVTENPHRDYKIIDEKTGQRLRRSKYIDYDEEIRKFAESEVGGNY